MLQKYKISLGRTDLFEGRFTPDGSEKPCADKTDFFLTGQSDQRKLLRRLRKNGFDKQACSEQQD